MPRIFCQSGFSMSVQASDFHMCYPKLDWDDLTPPHTTMGYEEFECGKLSQHEPLLMPYIIEVSGIPPSESVYGWVPREVIDEVIDFHGGIQTLIDCINIIGEWWLGSQPRYTKDLRLEGHGESNIACVETAPQAVLSRTTNPEAVTTSEFLQYLEETLGENVL